MRSGKLRTLICWGPLVAALLATAVLWTLVDRWWALLPLGYGPRWPWIALIPLPLLAGGSWQDRTLAALGTVLVVSWGLLGFRLPSPLDAATGRDTPRVRVAVFNTGQHSTALNDFLAEAKARQSELVVVVECPARNQRNIVIPEYQQVNRGEICVWARTRETPRLRMAPRNPTVIGWSGAIAVAELPGSALGSVGIVHLRSVRTELSEFLDLSEVPAQADSMESRHAKRLRGSSFASTWFRSLEPAPALVVGDFNLIPESVQFRRDWGYWDDAWDVAGLGTGYTWYSRWSELRIDRVLTSDAWRPVEVHVVEVSGSDHRAVFVELISTDDR